MGWGHRCAAVTKPVARVEVRKVTPRARICSTQGWKIRSPTLPLHHLTSKEVCKRGEAVGTAGGHGGLARAVVRGGEHEQAGGGPLGVH